jgi:hypothetical protein
MDSYKFLLVWGLDAQKSWEGYRGGFIGVLRILVCFVVVNRGEVVVDCVVDRGELWGVFCGIKTCHFFQIYF